MATLRFIHIPKTAGTTFTQILKRQYPGKHNFFSFSGNIEVDLPRYNSLTEKEKKSIELFTGHAPITTGIPEADNTILILFLRDPISRVKSFCQHVSEGKSPYLLKKYPPESFNLGKFLQCGNQELSNMQTKMLINEGPCVSPYLIKDMSQAEAKDLALYNLSNRVSCFGIQEYFEESVVLFSDFFQWRVKRYKSLNRKDSKKRLIFNDSHIEKIIELNKIDIDVYNAAKEVFFQNISSQTLHKRNGSTV